MFAAHLNRWYRENKARFEDFALLEEAAGGVYAVWADSPLKAAGGVSPRGYFDAIKSPDALIRTLIRYSAADMSPPDLLIERIAAVPECRRYLYEILRADESAELSAVAAGLLCAGYGRDIPDPDGFGKKAYGLLSDNLFDDTKRAEARELAARKLSDCAEFAAPYIYERMRGRTLSPEAEAYAADVLVYAPRDERTYALLTRLFSSGRDNALYASYLCKYGDERALPTLAAFAKRRGITREEFMETRNAIEALGGTLDGGAAADFAGDGKEKENG